eukprot:142034-Chlamydomonas_euryale.AAC.1
MFHAYASMRARMPPCAQERPGLEPYLEHRLIPHLLVALAAVKQLVLRREVVIRRVFTCCHKPRVRQRRVCIAPISCASASGNATRVTSTGTGPSVSGSTASARRASSAAQRRRWVHPSDKEVLCKLVAERRAAKLVELEDAQRKGAKLGRLVAHDAAVLADLRRAHSTHCGAYRDEVRRTVTRCGAYRDEGRRTVTWCGIP